MKTNNRLYVRIRIPLAAFLFAVAAFVLSPSQVLAGEEKIPLVPQHGIPLVVVYVNENRADINAARDSDPDHNYGNIQEMNASGDHSVRALGDVRILVPEGYIGEYGSASVPAGRISLSYIRGRGNSTWTEEKRPYKIHFKEAQNLFGMGAGKDWALMAHAMDPTLVRNRLTLWIGSQIGLPYTPQMIPVDVIMIGLQKDENGDEQEVSRDYLGSYCLSETVEIGDSRVEIDALKKKDESEPAITGGYLMAIYCSAQDENKVSAASHFTTPSGLEITNKDPEFDGEDLSAGRQAQRDYIHNYMNQLDRLIMESEEITPDIHEQIGQLMDFRSLADYWWIQEFSFNTDAYGTGSTYMYKARNGKLYWGPLWDFDLAWSVGLDTEEGYVKGFNNTELSWADQLREKDPEFVALLKERWNDENGIRDALRRITENSREGILNRYRDEVAASRAANEERWPQNYDEYAYKDYGQTIEKFRYWIDKRIAWIDENLDQLGSVYYTVTYETDDGQVFRTETVRETNEMGKGPDGPEKEGYLFMGWKDKLTGQDHELTRVTEDKTFIPYYKKESEAIAPKGLFLPCYEDWYSYGRDDGEPEYYDLGDPVVIPDNADVGRIIWTTSNESILYFDAEGVPQIKGTGDVDVTARTRNGLSKTMRVHVYDPRQEGMEMVLPESVSPEQSSYTIRKGETIQVLMKVLPEGKPVPNLYYSYEFDDEKIDINSSCNLISGVKAGKTTVKVTAADMDESFSLTTSFQVIVTDETGPVDISHDKVSLSSKTLTYNGKVLRPRIRTVGGRVLTEGKDYSIKWSNKSSKKIGTYTLTLTGKGNYTGKVKASYKILPRGTRISKWKKGRKAVVVRWKRQSKKMPSSRIVGYQIQLATDKKFSKNKKSLKVKGFKRTKKKISGLKSHKKYYVRIRTYLYIKGRAYASKWSPVIKVKTR